MQSCNTWLPKHYVMLSRFSVLCVEGKIVHSKNQKKPTWNICNNYPHDKKYRNKIIFHWECESPRNKKNIKWNAQKLHYARIKTNNLKISFYMDIFRMETDFSCNFNFNFCVFLSLSVCFFTYFRCQKGEKWRENYAIILKLHIYTNVNNYRVLSICENEIV